MIKVYVMPTCPDCEVVERQAEGSVDFEIIDISKHVRNLKEFIKLRDTDPAFDEAKKSGALGIPCFVLEDGTVSLDPTAAGLESDQAGPTCRLDGSGC